MNDKMTELCELLRLAGNNMLALGKAPTLVADYDYPEDLGRFILSCRDVMKAGEELTPPQRRELWTIFAPTCDWDNSGGAVDLGNEVFAILDDLYGDEIKKTSNQ